MASGSVGKSGGGKSGGGRKYTAASSRRLTRSVAPSRSTRRSMGLGTAYATIPSKYYF